MKRVLVPFLILLTWSAQAYEPGAPYFEQMDDLLPTPTETRIATGAPGPKYWPNKIKF